LVGGRLRDAGGGEAFKFASDKSYIESDRETQKKFSQPLTFLPAGEAMPNLALHAVVTIQRNRG
jgi:hypothetical protein